MALLLKGANVNEKLNETIKQEVEVLKQKGVIPKLGIIRVGEREEDISYERGAMKRCNMLGVEVTQFLLPEQVSENELLQVIKKINEDDSIHGVLLFRPLPKHLNEERICQAIEPKKDVDGITNGSLTGVFTGEKKGFAPCTAQACMEILDFYGIDSTGKKAIVVGRSLVVGKPVAMLLLQKNATVTICHTKTKDMEAVIKEADIVIVAAGRKEEFNQNYFRKDQVVIDVGIHVNEAGKLCGDVKFDEVEPIVDSITPVPGGVGTVTTSVLVSHVVEAAKRA
ncbi:bifunctional 5,10-methylenetetrahydrofolate dehydrogenase/5,10-methenyltetrahydrofolate cyclohydrolase [Velocimicrobium porci]|uniref:Bifunctional protein FolD n=1 Tax=Velocimicrobium porci TaxID=2606634 RepID=A0A6L5XUT9_9FIRM|nr:bifunctional 5,10-methylenetetrahydrofolate dehydrogenase/5,10-methenyltetrahydrofolate cyclohydrolase [Velocimicrobium porci]MSS62482.1 bifunctional 5,10-methylenetetrahydrofolate dehydrogenase/5,10-methenyltetrahydrofolate cyclohydrolase [Velocimicrobium porci]